MAKWRDYPDRANAKRVRDNLHAGRYGLKPCPDCGRLNGMLSRDEALRCCVGTGCRKLPGRVTW